MVEIKDGAIKLKTIEPIDLREFWEISYGPRADLAWMKTNGPYFKDVVLSWEEFTAGFGGNSVGNPRRMLLYYEDTLIGFMSAYWEDVELEQWLEMGICIYDPDFWGKGIAQKALPLWTSYLFQLYPHIQRIGFTTWSGNKGMMKVGEKCGLQQEARVRKVRRVAGKYYDSIKYGILREEWAALQAK